MGLTGALCQRIAALQADSIPAQAYALADQVVLDGLAVAVAGATQTPARILASYVREQGGQPLATAIGCGYRASLFQAAYVNAVSMHALDYEPMFNPSNHATSPVLPGLLALAETRGLDGRELATALIKGIEMQARLRIATGAIVRFNLHPPGVLGVMGAAVGAAHLLELDAERLQHALGIAASRCGGLLANQSSMVKCTHLGLAAAHGLEAAMLAQRGFTANPDVIEHPSGYAQAYIQGKVDDATLLSFGSPWRLIEARYSIKLYPCIYPTHWGIDAALQLKDRIPSTEDIAAVAVTTLAQPAMRRRDKPQPRSEAQAKASLQYTLACALADGHVGIDHFTEQCLARADIRALMAKIRLTFDESRPAPDDQYWLGLAVTLRSGETLESCCDRPAGHHSLPMVSLERHRTKLEECLKRALSDDDAQEVLALAGNFHCLKNREIRRMMELLGRPAN